MPNSQLSGQYSLVDYVRGHNPLEDTIHFDSTTRLEYSDETRDLTSYKYTFSEFLIHPEVHECI